LFKRSGLLAFVFLLALVTPAYPQGGGSISGVVKDSAGGVIPGASVIAKNNATGTTFDTATNSEGVFSLPALDAGLYTITVKLEGFKTAVIADIRVSPGTPTNLNAVLELGALAETVNVTSSSELINTQTATISSTLNVDQVNRMPMPSRNALNAVTFLPGVNTAGVNRDSTINGLPDSFINITMDGVSNNDNFNKTGDGFFASVTPRQDAIEAVTVTTAVGGADTGGHGAVTINFQTRSGSNRYTGSLYEYFRHKGLNTNYWFNERNGLPKNDVKLNQYGIRQGGPIILPGLYDGSGKAFFFVNYEELQLPNDFTRTRSVLHPRAQEGWFRYNVTSGGVQTVREVNVLTLAAGAGHLTTKDPMVLKLQGFINAATGKTGVLNATSDPMLMDYVWQSPGYQWERQPVVRIDYNITPKHRLSGTYNQLWTERDPDHLNGADVRFPGAPNYRVFWSTRPTRSFTLRSSLNQNLVSEARVGITKGGTSYFGKNQYEGRGVPAFDDMDGFAIDFDSDIGVTNWWTTNGPSWRAAYQWTFDETITWQKGKHGLSFGGSAFLGRAFENAQTLVPTIQLGFSSDFDPARGLFNSTNFASASNNQLTDARQLYGMLTGRVTSVGGQAVLVPETGTYQGFVPRTRRGNMDVYSLFVQDSWRTTPTLTINAGLRWDVQMPFSPADDVFSQAYLEDACGMSGLGPNTTIYNKCNFLSPGSSGGKVPEYARLGSGALGYNIDWNNLAPNVGVAWRPNVQTGWLRTLLGDPEQATLRGGYSVSYERQGMGVFTGLYGSNPGATLSLTRSASSAEPLVPAGQAWPVLLQERSRIYPASFPERPTYPIGIRPNRADDLNLFAPDIEVGSARSWTVSFQRAITRNTAVDVRYVGTRGVNQWSELDYNAIRGENLVAANFVSEFRLAQQNLTANNAAGIAGRQRGVVYELALERLGIRGAPRARQPERHRRGGRPRGEHDAPEQLDRGGSAGQPLPAKPARGCGQRHRQRRVQRLPRTAGRAAAPHVARAAGERQLPVRARRGLVVPRLQPGARHDALEQRAPRVQDAVGLDGSGRPRPAVRQQPEPDPQRDPRRVADERRRPRAGRDRELRQRAARGHGHRRSDQDVQARHPDRSGNRIEDGVHAPRRRDPQHAPRVQHQRVDG
jgi:hypothetical protein